MRLIQYSETTRPKKTTGAPAPAAPASLAPMNMILDQAKMKKQSNKKYIEEIHPFEFFS